MTIAGVLGNSHIVFGAIGQFYDKNKTSSYIKRVICIYFRNDYFLILPVLIGTIIDFKQNIN
jgi:hypothetical protein